jgi:hypothetical protein
LGSYFQLAQSPNPGLPEPALGSFFQTIGTAKLWLRSAKRLRALIWFRKKRLFFAYLPDFSPPKSK